MKRMISSLALILVLVFSGLAFAGSEASVDGVISSSGSSAVIVNNDAVQYLNAPTNFPNIIPMLQGGKVGDVTGLMPKFSFKALTPLNREKDVVKDVIGVYQGWLFNRIRLDEIEVALIEKARDLQAAGKDINKIRYQVQYKDSVTSSGVGGGISGSLSGELAQGNGASGTLSVLPGTHRSTADPMYILKFFLIE